MRSAPRLRQRHRVIVPNLASLPPWLFSYWIVGQRPRLRSHIAMSSHAVRTADRMAMRAAGRINRRERPPRGADERKASLHDGSQRRAAREARTARAGHRLVRRLQNPEGNIAHTDTTRCE